MIGRNLQRLDEFRGHPLPFLEVEAVGMRIRIGDIPVETAAALWGGAFLVLVGVVCVIMASRR